MEGMKNTPTTGITNPFIPKNRGPSRNRQGAAGTRVTRAESIRDRMVAYIQANQMQCACAEHT